jgi:hypothetical protein
MRRFRVVYAADARRDYKREVSRWRLVHPTNTYQLEDEIESAEKVLSAVPRYGEAARDVKLDGARRVVLARSGFLLYYFMLDDRRQVAILRLWYAGRGKRPSLRLVRPKDRRR